MASVWDPHHTSDTNKLEQVQHRAARFVCNNYSPYSSVTQMLSDLGWQQLKDRRKHIRLALSYKIVHHLIAVPHEDILRKADSRTWSSHNYKYRTLRSYKDPYTFSFFSPDYTGMESPASGHSAFGHHWYFSKQAPSGTVTAPARRQLWAGRQHSAGLGLHLGSPTSALYSHMEVCRVFVKSRGWGGVGWWVGSVVFGIETHFSRHWEKT